VAVAVAVVVLAVPGLLLLPSADEGRDCALMTGGGGASPAIEWRSSAGRGADCASRGLGGDMIFACPNDLSRNASSERDRL